MRQADPDGGPPSVLLQMVAIKRKDTGEWAIPGGMQDPGEIGMATLVREFKEEAGAVSESEKASFDAMVDELFKDSNGRVIYRGYVDDPRNTDNAWMETIAMHFHCSDRMGERLTLKAGDDAADVTWLEVNPENPAYCALYASHKQIADLVYVTHGGGSPIDASLAGRRFSTQLAEMSSNGSLLLDVSDDSAEGSSSGGERGRIGQCVDGLSEAARWGWAALTSAEHPFVANGLSACDLLDINSICAQEMRVASLAIGEIAQVHEEGHGEDAHACTTRIANKLCKGDMTVAANVFENLKAIQPIGPLLPRLHLLAALLYDWSSQWTFAEDGEPNAPRLPVGSAPFFFRLDARTVSAWRVLCFLDKPPALSHAAEIARLRASLLTPARCAFRPFALVMAGPPGSGKSRSLARCVPLVASGLGGPAQRSAYAEINPDVWISDLCDNNNAYRNVANYCNHETFLSAVAQRRHLIFDGTGKSLVNTCSRIIARLQGQGYHVIICVVLSKMATCWRRIEARREATDRAVPRGVLSATVRDLQRAVPVYIEGPQNGLCEATYLFANEDDDATEGLDFTIGADTPAADRARAAARAAGLLTLEG